MKRLPAPPAALPALLLAFCTLFAPLAAQALTIAKGVPFYARDMEYYYREQRAETLPGILRTFDAQGVLADSRKQLALAAFLAEVLRRDPSARPRLLPPAPSLSRDGRRTLAWAAHLAQLPDADALIQSLLQPDDALLLRQITASPAPLLRWNLYAEKTVLQMYWTAYLASGDAAYLDPIIAAALRYARLNAAGLQNDPDFSVSAAAAASLYDMAPRHPEVDARVAQALNSQSGPEAATLRTILRR
ncbi:translation initiation factor 2 [Desulfovibrio legallii]|uniref:translation initiation factor 2 n=1 Tax=Desulfovibrio legallii TaxID=571438 RepID=UPI000E517FB4|nr:translation initiation factor 2 [Desulfovibrio legallii]RHH24212.1 translation initiation factor 2 [Desulfovibrio sp. AM18-2]